jgi:hypothetical protein
VEGVHRTKPGIKAEHSMSGESDDCEAEQARKRRAAMGTSIAVGAAMGAALGVTLGNLGFGIAIGTAIGAGRVSRLG